MNKFKLNLSDDLYDKYSSGKCMELAASLHRRLAWRIEAVVTTDQNPNYVEHAWVVDPTEKLMLDIDGLNSVDNNGWIHPRSVHHKNLSEIDLVKLVISGMYEPMNFSIEQWNIDVGKAIEDCNTSSSLVDFIEMYGYKKRHLNKAKFENNEP